HLCRIFLPASSRVPSRLDAPPVPYPVSPVFFFFNAPATPEIYTLSLHDSLPLATVGLPLALVSPRSVRDFARAVGRNRGGRDHAALLAHFAELVRPETPKVPDSLVEHLRALKARREFILEMLALERSRIDTEFVAVHR